MKLLKRILFSSILISAYTSAQEIKAEYKREVKDLQQISYVFDYPQNTKGNIPLLVFLHGSGERGSDLEQVKAHSPFTYKNLIKEPVAILAPQCPAMFGGTQKLYTI